MILASGVFKLACAVVSGWIRRLVPRAGLLGSLTAIALVIISFLPLLDIAAQPVAGFVVAGRHPGDPDGALGAAAAGSRAPWRRWLVGCLVYYGMHLLGLGPGARGARGRRPSAALRLVLPVPVGAWLGLVRRSLARGARLPAGGDPAGPGDGRRRDRLHRERRGGRRRLPDRPDHRRRGARHARRRALRRGDPVDPVHRPPRLQGDGGPRRLHAGDRPVRRRRRGSSATSTGSSS